MPFAPPDVVTMKIAMFCYILLLLLLSVLYIYYLFTFIFVIDLLVLFLCSSFITVTSHAFYRSEHSAQSQRGTVLLSELPNLQRLHVSSICFSSSTFIVPFYS